MKCVEVAKLEKNSPSFIYSPRFPTREQGDVRKEKSLFVNTQDTRAE